MVSVSGSLIRGTESLQDHDLPNLTARADVLHSETAGVARSSLTPLAGAAAALYVLRRVLSLMQGRGAWSATPPVPDLREKALQTIRRALFIKDIYSQVSKDRLEGLTRWSDILRWTQQNVEPSDLSCQYDLVCWAMYAIATDGSYEEAFELPLPKMNVSAYICKAEAHFRSRNFSVPHYVSLARALLDAHAFDAILDSNEDVFMEDSLSTGVADTATIPEQDRSAAIGDLEEYIAWTESREGEAALFQFYRFIETAEEGAQKVLSQTKLAFHVLSDIEYGRIPVEGVERLENIWKELASNLDPHPASTGANTTPPNTSVALEDIQPDAVQDSSLPQSATEYLQLLNTPVGFRDNIFSAVKHAGELSFDHRNVFRDAISTILDNPQINKDGEAFDWIRSLL